MNDTMDLTWTEQFGTDQLITRLDETVLELDMLKMKYKELRQEATMYEKLYHEAMRKAWTVGL